MDCLESSSEEEWAMTYEESARLSHESPLSLASLGGDTSFSPRRVGVVSVQSSTVSQLIRELQDEVQEMEGVAVGGGVTPQGSTVSQLIRELQEQGRDTGGGVPTPRGGSRSMVTPRRKRLSEMMVSAGVDARDDVMVESDIGAGQGFVDYFATSLRNEDAALRAIEDAATFNVSRADSIYSMVQLQAAGLQEDNEALSEKVSELQQDSELLRSDLQKMVQKSLALVQENSELRAANRGLENMANTLQMEMCRKGGGPIFELDLLQATTNAHKQELEMELTKMGQRLHQGKREAQESVQQQIFYSGDIERRAEEGLQYKRNYDTVYAQSQLLQERVNSLEKDLLESQQRMASEALLLEAAYHKDEVARINVQLIAVQAETETQKSVLMDKLNDTRSLLELELEKNRNLAYFQNQWERIDMTQLCSTQELNLAQQLLLIERAKSTIGDCLFDWIAWYKRKRSLGRARAWLTSRRARMKKLNALHLMHRLARRGKKLNQILFSFQWRKGRSLQWTVVLQWAKTIRLVRAFNAAANALIQRSHTTLARDALVLWQQVVERQRMADQHGKSAGLRRSLMVATAAMGTLEAQDFQNFLPTLAPGVYGTSSETPMHIWDVIVASVCVLYLHTYKCLFIHCRTPFFSQVPESTPHCSKHVYCLTVWYGGGCAEYAETHTEFAPVRYSAVAWRGDDYQTIIAVHSVASAMHTCVDADDVEPVYAHCKETKTLLPEPHGPSRKHGTQEHVL